MTASKLKLEYIIKIMRIDVSATGSVDVVALVKWRGNYATIEFQSSGGWKTYHSGNFPGEVLLDAKEELKRRIEKIVEKAEEILTLGNGLGLVINFK